MVHKLRDSGSAEEKAAVEEKLKYKMRMRLLARVVEEISEDRTSRAELLEVLELSSGDETPLTGLGKPEIASKVKKSIQRDKAKVRNEVTEGLSWLLARGFLEEDEEGIALTSEGRRVAEDLDPDEE